MKKLLVLMLVLGVGSFASATLVTGNVSWDVVGWQLIGTGTALGDVDLNLALSTFTTVAGTVNPDPTTDGVLSDGVMAIAGNKGKVLDNDTYYNLLGGDVQATTQALGVWYRFDIQKAGITVDLYDSAFGPIGSIVIFPEPTSMVLLGLGGLLLRRRREDKT